MREAGPTKQEEMASCRVISESRKCPIKRPCPGGEQLGLQGSSGKDPEVNGSRERDTTHG